MKNILLMCSAGMSTSMLVKKMQEAAAKMSEEIHIKAIAEQALSENITGTDIILLGPQVRFLKDKVEAEVSGNNIPVRVIETMDYGMMNGEKILLQALDIIEGKK